MMVSFRWRQYLVVCVAVLGLALGACSDNKKNPAAPEPEPEIPSVTQTFRGNIGQLEVDCNNFSMSNPGPVELQITELQPLTTLTVGMVIGTLDSSVATGCAPFAEDETVKLFETFLSAGLDAGTYCTCIGDVGNIFPGETVNYALAVTHPQ